MVASVVGWLVRKIAQSIEQTVYSSEKAIYPMAIVSSAEIMPYVINTPLIFQLSAQAVETDTKDRKEEKANTTHAKKRYCTGIWVKSDLMKERTDFMIQILKFLTYVLII